MLVRAAVLRTTRRISGSCVGAAVRFHSTRAIATRLVDADREEDTADADADISTHADAARALHKSSIGAVRFPVALRAAIDRYVDDLPYSRRELRLDVERTFGHRLDDDESEDYDAQRQKKNPRQHRMLRMQLRKRQIQQYGPRESAAYAASQTAAHYSVALRVLAELEKRVPEFRPRSLLDFGTGPGTVFWAAWQLWGSSIERMHGVDISEDMITLAQTLMLRASEIAVANNGKSSSRAEDCKSILSSTIPPLARVKFQQYLPLHTAHSSTRRSDLVTAAFALGHLPTDNIRALTLRTLWSLTADTLVLVEPGSPEGYRNIVNARHYLLDLAERERVTGDKGDHGKMGAYCVAPCPHDGVCPLLNATDMWCNFRVRVAHDALVRADRTQPNIDRSFSYLILRRGTRPTSDTAATAAASSISPLIAANTWPRVLPKVKKQRGQVHMTVCQPDGTVGRVSVSKARDRGAYKLARKIDWGDLWPGGAYEGSNDAAVDGKYDEDAIGAWEDEEAGASMDNDDDDDHDNVGNMTTTAKS